MFMVLSWVYTASMIIKSIVYEKEQKLRETMRVLGMNNGIHWCSWFLDSIIPMLITVFVLSTVLVVSIYFLLQKRYLFNFLVKFCRVKLLRIWSTLFSRSFFSTEG